MIRMVWKCYRRGRRGVRYRRTLSPLIAAGLCMLLWVLSAMGEGPRNKERKGWGSCSILSAYPSSVVISCLMLCMQPYILPMYHLYMCL